MWLSSLYAIVLNFARVICVGNIDNVFVWPPKHEANNRFAGNSLWPFGSKQRVVWSTTLDSYHIILFQEAIDPPAGSKLTKIYGT